MKKRVIFICTHTKETCPYYPDGEKYLHKSFNDTSGFKGKDGDILIVFKNVRDEIKDWLKDTFNP